jgi:uncharacterized membrane protein YeaQ/YmgE (transglycosylase-associated protein family)
MYLLAWILIGAVVGWGAGRFFQGNGYGPFMDALMGVGGGVVGGVVMRSEGFGGTGGTVLTTMVAMSCATLMAVLGAEVNGRRIYARQI